MVSSQIRINFNVLWVVKFFVNDVDDSTLSYFSFNTLLLQITQLVLGNECILNANLH